MQTFRLRRDNEDYSEYHLMYDVPSLIPGNPCCSLRMLSMREDVLEQVFGKRVYAEANELAKGASMVVLVSAQPPERVVQDRIDGAHASVLCGEDHSDDDTVLSGEIPASDSDAAVMESSL